MMTAISPRARLSNVYSTAESIAPSRPNSNCGNGICNSQFTRMYKTNFYHFLLNYHKYRCKYSENSLIITIFAVRFKCI